ncbi:YceG family protein [Clostridium sp. MB40-C1]|uniref:YceG family protein n=1 Tax=Clostridium sp. MB40-C1 TaxID=3070996 RepID=UPI0027E11E82|nr:YceG family protein [Clostridium sp. MB40-C1]WMJ79913.1 YceG family protein [Clostridium sp. MB40-C1]
MISIRKFINPSLQNSCNIFNDIFIPVNRRIGFMNGPSPIMPIYFYRCIGIKEDEKEYYDCLNKLDKKLANLNELNFKFIDSIPFKTNVELMNKVQSMWANNELKSISSAETESLIKLLKVYKIIPSVNELLLNSSIEEGINYILRLYLKKEANLNLTKVKNFILKLITWINDFVPILVNKFDVKNTQDIINPKVIYYGDIKKHEVLFLIFLSRIGCDVLYINSPSDGDFSIIDKEGNYSKIMTFPKNQPFDTKRILEDSSTNKSLNISSNLNGDLKNSSTDAKTSNINTNNINTRINTKTVNINNNLARSQENKVDFHLDDYTQAINSTIKDSNDILKEFTDSLNNRGGFIGKPLPIIPVYFYRYIGISENKDEYYNSLYRLDKKLESLGDLYLKFTSDIPIESNTELIKRTNSVWNSLNNFDKSKKDILMGLLVKAEAFPDLREKIIISSIVKSFNSILELYINNEVNINGGRVKNFCLKILMWIHKYLPDLFKKFDYLKNSTGEIYNPKILYYGYIKKHEAYFLMFLAKMGCDIIYINSYSDEIFSEIDREAVYTKSVVLPDKEQLKDFPKEEIMIREETTAFKASREIANVIYNDEDGLYKPWQFEEYGIYPVTLKTTYDELKILWKEEARMRPSFKIENKTVYIPNLFAKISGTNKDINLYWQDFCKFKDSENVFFIPDIPYIKREYSRYNLYSLEYCFGQDKLIDKESLFKNKLYKFSYLKTALQDTIVDKINQLLKLSPFKHAIDTEFRLKILMTVLNMDTNILELIQKFDYPFSIPKLVIYDNDKDIFSDEDTIILAFLNLMGFDIVIFTPTGYNNIEQKIDDKYYDTHKLEDIKFDLQVPNNFKGIRKNKQGSFWSNLFR